MKDEEKDSLTKVFKEIKGVKKNISDICDTLTILATEIKTGFKIFTKAFTDAINPPEQQSKPMKDDYKRVYL